MQKVKHHVEQIERELREFQTTSQNSQNVLLRLGGNGLFVRQKEFMDSLVKSPGFLNGGVLGPCGKNHQCTFYKSRLFQISHLDILHLCNVEIYLRVFSRNRISRRSRNERDKMVWFVNEFQG